MNVERQGSWEFQHMMRLLSQRDGFQVRDRYFVDKQALFELAVAIRKEKRAFHAHELKIFLEQVHQQDDLLDSFIEKLKNHKTVVDNRINEVADGRRGNAPLNPVTVHCVMKYVTTDQVRAFTSKVVAAMLDLNEPTIIELDKKTCICIIKWL